MDEALAQALRRENTRLRQAVEALGHENARLRRHVEELSMLRELASSIGAARDLEGVMQTLVQRSIRLVGAEQGTVTLVGEAEGDPTQTLVRLSDLTRTQPAYRPGQRLLGWMQRHKRALILNDPAGDDRFDAAEHGAAIRSVLCAPLLVRNRLIGILTLYNKKASGGFTEGDEQLLRIIAGQSAQVVQNARLNEERSRILTIFGQHTAPAVVEALLREGAGLASQRRHVCVMFLDIRGFTAFAEQHAPEQAVDYLNRLFDFMIELVNRHHGVVHQLLGDGFMALFGAPVSRGNDCQNAVDAALAILARVRAAAQAREIPPTRLGIGLHAGEVVAGIVGSTIHREYKVTGDVVNLAARIEQLNKQLDAQLLVSEAVWSAVDQPRLQAQPMGAVQVRGRAQPIRLYRLA